MLHGTRLDDQFLQTAKPEAGADADCKSATACERDALKAAELTDVDVLDVSILAGAENAMPPAPLLVTPITERPRALDDNADALVPAIRT